MIHIAHNNSVAKKSRAEICFAYLKPIIVPIPDASYNVAPIKIFNTSKLTHYLSIHENEISRLRIYEVQ